jgi:hypothetical protein
MNERIRDYQPSDRDPVVALSLRAWAPGFGSMEQVLGQEIFVRLHGEWAQYQAKAFEVLADDGLREGGLHADPDGQVLQGFVKLTSAVSTVPAVRPGAVWYFQ